MNKWPTVYKGLDRDLTVEITKTQAFDSGAGSWTWTLMVDAARTDGGTPALSKAAASATLSNSDKTITLVFNLTDTDTDALTEGTNYVDVKSDDDAGKVLPYPDAAGEIEVAVPVGS